MSMNNNVKQVLVIRKDLNMRKGKMAAQASHASLGAVLSCAINKDDSFTGYPMKMIPMDDGPLKDWLEHSFTKICVSVDSEQELLDIHQKAVEAGLINCLITDNGNTEFNGVPTLTCCAIGPAYSDEIDKITGGLKLL